MKEVISIHVGQGGIQVANAAWELFCAEHGIDCRGTLSSEFDNDNTFQSFFELTPKGQYVPRAVMLDLEPTVIDEVRSGRYRQLFHPDRLISGKEDAANNFARGHFTVGRLQIERSLDQVRRIADNCEGIQGFFVTHSCGGGTGSGYVALLMENLSIEFGKRTKIQLNIFPGATLSTAIVEPYNAILNTHATMEHSDLSLIYDNESLYDMCKNQLDLERPTYSDINRLTANVLSAMTVSMRFEGPLHSDFSQVQTNLVPYPRIHFPIISYAPILSSDRAEHQILTEMELTKSVFDMRNQMLSCNIRDGFYMSCCLLYRGDVNINNVYKCLSEIKTSKEMNFVDWCPTAFKIGVNRSMPCLPPCSPIAKTNLAVTLMCNTTAIVQAWRRLSCKYELLFSKRAFVHHFVGEGMEEGELSEAKDDIQTLIKDYEDAGAPTEGGDPVSMDPVSPDQRSANVSNQGSSDRGGGGSQLEGRSSANNRSIEKENSTSLANDAANLEMCG